MCSLQKPFYSCLWHFFHPSACPLSCSSSRIISHSLLPSLSLSPLSYFSICLILARPLTHKSNTGHLNTICLLPMESRMGWRESRRGSIAPRTVSPLTRFHIHLPIAPSFPPIPPLSFFMFCSKPNRVVTAHMLTQLIHIHLHISMAHRSITDPPWITTFSWMWCLRAITTPGAVLSGAVCPLVVSPKSNWSQMKGQSKVRWANLFTFSLMPSS